MTRYRVIAAPVGAHVARVRLMATADLHMSILPHDYHADVPSELPGLARLAALVARMRAEAGAALLFDCGDFLQGGPMADYYALERGLGPGELHPMIAAMNTLGYDGVTLGNHEFSYGVEFLCRALMGARFPVVSTNVVRRQGATPLEDTPLVAPWLLIDCPVRAAGPVPRGGEDAAGATAAPGTQLRIGVLGLAPPQTLEWERGMLRGAIAVRDMLEAAETWAPALRAAGADIVVVLAHSGIGPAAASPGMENAALPLSRVAGLDVLLLGHTHGVFPSPRFAGLAGVDAAGGRLNGLPAVMPGARGSHLGVIDLEIRREDGVWQAGRAEVAVMPTAPAPASAPLPVAPAHAGLAAAAERRVRAAAAPAHVETRAHGRRRLGRSAVPLHTHFARIAPSAALRLMAAALRDWAEGAVAGTGLAGLPIVSAVSAYRVGGFGGPEDYTDIPAGPLLMRHLHDLCPFPNRLCLLRTTGAGVAEWLERAAGQFAQLHPSAPDRPLLLPEAPGYQFDVVDGLDYAIDLARPARYDPLGRLVCPAARRVQGLGWRGRRLADDAPVLLVTNSHRAAGGGSYPGAGAGPPALESVQTVRDALARLAAAATRAGRPVAPPAPDATGTWRLVAPPGSTALFETGMAAAARLDEIAAYAPEALGRSAAGFLQLRLRF